MKNMKKESWFLLGGVLVAIIPAIFFLIYFHSSNVSLDIANWGQFGDFFGGTLNPLIGLATAYFAYQAYQNTKVSAQQQKFVTTVEVFLKSFEFHVSNLNYPINQNKLINGVASFKAIKDDLDSEAWFDLMSSDRERILLSLESLVESISALEDQLSDKNEINNFYKIIKAHAGRDFCGVIRIVSMSRRFENIPNTHLYHFKKINLQLNPILSG